MPDLNDMQKKIVDFRDARNWKQFHNPKDMAISLLLEASELLEHFQWKNPKEIEEHIASNSQDISDELVDVLYWVLLMSHDLSIDLLKEFDRKMQQNDKKYEVKRARGSHKKYTEL